MVDIKIDHQCEISDGYINLTYRTKCYTEIIPYLLFNVFGSNFKVNNEHPCLKVIELENRKKHKFIFVKEIDDLKIVDLFKDKTITITYKSKDNDETVKTSKSSKFAQLVIVFNKLKHRHKEKLEIIVTDDCCNNNYQYEHRIIQNDLSL